MRGVCRSYRFPTLLLMGSLFSLAAVRRSVLLCFSTIGPGYLRGRGPTSLVGVLLTSPGTVGVAATAMVAPLGEDTETALAGV